MVATPVRRALVRSGSYVSPEASPFASTLRGFGIVASEVASFGPDFEASVSSAHARNSSEKQAACHQHQEDLSEAAFARDAGWVRHRIIALEGELLQERVFAEELTMSERRQEAELVEIGEKSVASEEFLKLEALERHLKEEAHHAEVAESAAQVALEIIRNRVLDISSECGAFLLTEGGHVSNPASAIARVLSALRGSQGSRVEFGYSPDNSLALDQLRGVSLVDSVRSGDLVFPLTPDIAEELDLLLTELEAESVEVGELLRLAKGDTLLAGDRHERSGFRDAVLQHPALLERYSRLEMLRTAVESAEADLERDEVAYAEVEARYEAMESVTRHELEEEEKEYEDVMRECDLLQKQQKEWQNYQNRILRLAEASERGCGPSLRPQAFVSGQSRTSRDSETETILDSQLAPGGALADHTPNLNRVEELRCENVALAQRISLLEHDRNGLIESQETLIRILQARVPLLQQQAHKLSSAGKRREDHSK